MISKASGTFLLTTSFSKDEVWNHLPAKVQKQMIDKKLKFHIIDALTLPELDYAEINPATIKGSQLLRPLFEYPGA